ncbi:MAG TPA: FtsW/RodA/SpoVE family cell cycle protein [Paenibacillus sp.]
MLLSKWKKIDWMIVVILLIFMVISVALVHSGISAWPKFEGSDKRMVFYYLAGFICFFGMFLLDFRLLLKYHWFVLAVGLFLLVIVLFIGDTVNGAKGWIEIPGVGLNIQPAEFFKLVLIISLTALLGQRNKMKLAFWQDIVPLSLFALIPFGIVMKQNDTGNALSYLVILLGVLWIGKLKYSHSIIILLILAASLVVGIKSYIAFHDQIVTYLESTDKEHWLNRIDPWLLPDEASSDASYHTRNALVAIASGGMLGEGYMKGPYVQSGFVPYTYSDSIIVVVAEEFGFIGVSVLVLLYFILIYRLIIIALECKRREGPILIVGIIAMLLYQIFENIGMFIGLMPLTGITLPFISFGGSSLLINMISIGLVISIQLYGQEEDEWVATHLYKKVDMKNVE